METHHSHLLLSLKPTDWISLPHQPVFYVQLFTEVRIYMFLCFIDQINQSQNRTFLQKEEVAGYFFRPDIFTLDNLTTKYAYIISCQLF